MDKEVSPEGKLLSLIRRKKDAAPSGDTDKNSPSGTKTSLPLRVSQGGAKAGGDVLKLTNRLLVVPILALAGTIAVNYFSARDNEPASENKEPKAKKKKEHNIKIDLTLPKQRPFSYYQKKFEERDIFLSPWDKPQDSSAAPAAVEQDLREKFTLVGIILDQDPKAVVEDNASHETYFLSKGDSVADASVEAIEESRVIFLFNGERVELTQ